MTFQNYILEKADTLFQNLTSGRFWAWKVILTVTFIAIVCSFPNYHLLKDINSNARVQFINDQIKNPFDHTLTSEKDPGSHQAKRTFRILIPLIAHVLHLDYTSVFIIQNLTGIFFLYYLLLFFYKLTGDKLLVTYLMLGITSIYIGKTFYYDIAAYYDFFCLLIMLLILISDHNLITFFLTISGGFIDERFIIAIPIVLLYKIYNRNASDILKKVKISIPFALGVISILFIRSYLSWKFYFQTSTESVGLKILQENFHFIPIGIFFGFEFLWLIILFALFQLRSSKQDFIFISFIAAMGLVVAGSLMVYDITRSLSYLFPALLLAMAILKKENVLKLYTNSIKLCCIGCFALASFYVEGPNNSDWISPVFPKVIKLF